MAVPKRRMSRANTRSRRAQWKAKRHRTRRRDRRRPAAQGAAAPAQGRPPRPDRSRPPLSGRASADLTAGLRLRRASQVTLRRWVDTVAVRILVVDDDRAVRESCAGRFPSTATRSSWRRTAVEALDLIANDRPDALVLDVMMPRLDGLEVCRQLRSTGDDLPILVLTARDSVSERVAGLDAGADDYLPKPFALEELLARMRALLRRTDARRRRRVARDDVLRPDPGPGDPRGHPRRSGRSA